MTISIFLIYRLFRKVRKVEPIDKEKHQEKNEPIKIDSNCCGAHEVCEFDSSIYDETEIIYFEDEELDSLRNVREDEFTNQQIDDLREVLYTLRPSEINLWLISLGRRHIHLPDILLQEAREIMADIKK
jgi:hypothetical protein